MKTNYLLAHKYKKLGWLLFILGIIFASIIRYSKYSFVHEPEFLNFKVLSLFDPGDPFHPENKKFFKIIEKNIGGEIALLLLIIGGLIVSFSKEKIEDEFKIRFHVLGFTNQLYNFNFYNNIYIWWKFSLGNGFKYINSIIIFYYSFSFLKI